MGRILRSLATGLVIGAGAGFLLGYNSGRGAPLLSNPMAHHHAVRHAPRGPARKVLDSARRGVERIDQALEGR